MRALDWLLLALVAVLAVGLVALAAAVRELGHRLAENAGSGGGGGRGLTETLELAPGAGAVLEPDPGDGESILLVLSTVCASCEQVVGELAAGAALPAAFAYRVLMVGSDPDEIGGAIDRLPPALRHRARPDVAGELAREHLGVDVSPAAVRHPADQVVDAFVFSSLDALRLRLAAPAPSGHGAGRGGS